MNGTAVGILVTKRRRAFSRPGQGLLELLLAASIFTVALVPLMYLFRLSRPPEKTSEMEFTATLLAHHVMEKILAEKLSDPRYLPPVTSEDPTVVIPGKLQPVSEFFRGILGKETGLEETDQAKLYWLLKPFSCQVNNYYLDDYIYKIIVYITYEEEGKNKRVFVEHLLHHPPSPEGQSDAEAAP